MHEQHLLIKSNSYSAAGSSYSAQEMSLYIQLGFSTRSPQEAVSQNRLASTLYVAQGTSLRIPFRLAMTVSYCIGAKVPISVYGLYSAALSHDKAGDQNKIWRQMAENNDKKPGNYLSFGASPVHATSTIPDCVFFRRRSQRPFGALYRRRGVLSASV